MKRAVLSLPGILILFFSLSVSAQKSKQDRQVSYPEFNLRTSLTSFLDEDAGIMLGVNYRWSQKFSASFEPTWIFFSVFSSAGSEKIYPSGIKIRTDLRYHFPKKQRGSPDFFIAPEFHYKYTKTQIEDLFGINCQNGQCAFFQDAVYTDIKREIGGLVKMGLITPFPFIDNGRWLLEFYGGLGIKRLDFRETNLPIGGSFVSPPSRTPFGQPGSGFGLPMLPGGLKLIFVL